MAELSLVFLFLLRRSPERPGAVYYESLPRYLRALCRLLRIPQPRLADWLGRLCGTAVERCPQRDEVAGFPAVHYKSMTAATEIAEALLPELEADASTDVLGRLVGSEPALAHVALDVAHHQLWPWILAVMVTTARYGGPVLAVPHVAWAEGCLRHIHERLPEEDLRFFVWPRWCRTVWQVCGCAASVASVLALFGREIARHGIRLRGGDRRKFVLMTEYVDPARLNGGAFDADFWVGETGIPAAEILFYLTGRQKRFLERNGCCTDEVMQPIRRKGYRLALLGDEPYAPSVLRSLLLLVAGISRARPGWLSSAVVRGWSDYLEYAPLFANYAAGAVLSARHPNGRTSWRTDGAILTGLARNHGVRSFGLQSRIYHGRLYEFFFECFDVTLAWGAAWYERLEGGCRFLGRTVEVGCISLDSLVRAHEALLPQNLEGKLRVVVFPAEPAGVHYTLGYGRSFLGACARLALEHPDYEFKVKCKDPQDGQAFLKDDDLRALAARASNFSFVDLKRHEYVRLLASADIVLAVGFTTPGTEALLLGKKTIYYSELGRADGALGAIPELTAHSEEELRELFRCAVEQGWPPEAQAAALDGLDPFRDGRCRDRIVALLKQEGTAA